MLTGIRIIDPHSGLPDLGCITESANLEEITDTRADPEC